MSAGTQVASETVLRVTDLEKTYRPRGIGGLGRQGVRAVAGVSFELRRGETLAVVGESGCGKSSVANAVLQLDPPTGGKVEFLGRDLATLSQRQLSGVRRELQVVFQDPYASLNNRMRVGQLVAEPLHIHHRSMPAKERLARVKDVLDKVGLRDIDLDRYPQSFSGGQRQRLGIARAIIVDPTVVVCDEAVSALDVSVQAQVLNLLADLQRDHRLAYLFITHDLGVVRQIADRVAVMYLGRFVEVGDAGEVFENPRHPYTRALLDAVPGQGRTERFEASGDVPDPRAIPSGCPFHPRCPARREELCDTDRPALDELGDTGRLVACHYPLPLADAEVNGAR
ncbi:MAG: ATP-binding cassette domain-containing protein [Streptosporangiales bacterium]|nr:ATP-binding cassette domain-containing protein [Streptosporangiales bacterium]